LSAVASGSTDNTKRCCSPSHAAAPPRWVDIAISARTADILPSLITRAATAHCPRCQGNARLRWLQARERELLPTHYVHVVFTLPRELAPLALQNKRLIYNLLFHASAETLLEIARDPRHLGAEIGFFSVLHTWDQRLQQNPHS
jgi:Transposase zinc-binding domain